MLSGGIFNAHMTWTFGKEDWHGFPKFIHSFSKFISLGKLFSIFILDIQISWRHQMSKHKKRNSFYWITHEVNTLLMEFSQFISYYKRKKIMKKLYEIWDLKTSSRSFCVCKEVSTMPIGKWNFWNKLLILDI